MGPDGRAMAKRAFPWQTVLRCLALSGLAILALLQLPPAATNYQAAGEATFPVGPLWLALLTYLVMGWTFLMLLLLNVRRWRLRHPMKRP